MIYPPINDLVNKVGTRYELAILTARRAREISDEERMLEKEKERSHEQGNLDARLKERTLERNKSKYPKPIIKALEEIITGDYYIDESPAKE